MKTFPQYIFGLILLIALIPSAAWGATSLQTLPFASPTVGLTLDLPLTAAATTSGTVTSMRPSHATGGQVLYGDLTGNTTGTFIVWIGGGTVRSFVSLESAPLGVYSSIPAEGYSSTTSFGKVKVHAETHLWQVEGPCEFGPPLVDPQKTARSGKASAGGLGGIVEDQGGAAHPSTHIFHDLLHYDAGSAKVPVLNSYPHISTENQDNTPRAILYIDFNGDDFEGYTKPAFVGNNSQHILDQMDVIRIEDTFQIIAELFRPFNINVTTDLAQFLAAPKSRRGWIFMTNRTGGIAPRAGFGFTDEPAMAPARSGQRATGSGMIASHEAGHLMTIEHFGSETDVNYLGHPGYTGAPAGPANLWNTPTGSSSENRYRIRQWTEGRFTGAYYWIDSFKTQLHPFTYRDSLNTIDGKIGYRGDDRGDTQAQAALLALGAPTRGIIERTMDVDVFTFETWGTGDIEIDVLSLAAHINREQIDGNTGRSMPALDVEAKLYNEFGAMLAISDLETTLDANLSLSNEPAGTYFLHIRGTDAGDPLADPPTGYTEYGSLGSYEINAEYSTDPSAQGPNLQITSFTYGVSNTTPEGPWWWQITPTATVTNLGDEPAPAASVRTYIRQDSGPASPLSVTLDRHGVLTPGASTTVRMFFHRDLTVQAEGEYRLGAKADSENEFTESNEDNVFIDQDDVATVAHWIAETPGVPEIASYDPGEAVIVASGESVTFEALTTDPQGTPVTYYWDFDNDGISDLQETPAIGQPSIVSESFSASQLEIPKAFYIRVRAESVGENEVQQVKQKTPWCHEAREAGGLALPPLRATTVIVDQ